jgi:hypothetical protein
MGEGQDGGGESDNARPPRRPSPKKGEGEVDFDGSGGAVCRRGRTRQVGKPAPRLARVSIALFTMCLRYVYDVEFRGFSLLAGTFRQTAQRSRKQAFMYNRGGQMYSIHEGAARCGDSCCGKNPVIFRFFRKLESSREMIAGVPQSTMPSAVVATPFSLTHENHF